MLKQFIVAASSVCVLLAVNPVQAASKNNHQYHEHQKAHVLKVGLWGDQFYSKDPVEKEARAKQTIDSMNAHHLDLTLYAGDTKNGSSLCTDDAIGQDVKDRFNSLKAPTLYSLGDNEWTDCHRTNNGSYDPIERLAFLRATFFDKNLTQGQHPLRVQRQGALGQAYSENSRVIKNNVEFVALHITGSNNNFVTNDSQCFKKSDRTQADCDLASAEYIERNAQNIQWLSDSFAKARALHLAGIAIVVQADVFFPVELSDGGFEDDFMPGLDANNGYTDFYKKLEAETKNFDGRVVLIHGDSHYFKMDKPMYNDDGRLTPNFTRVQVFGEEDNSWVEMTVDPKTENVFSFQQVNLQ